MTKCRHDVSQDCPACAEETIELLARDSDAEFARLTGIIFDLVNALDKISAMDPFGLRGDDLGRAARIARIARDGIPCDVGSAQGSGNE